MKKCMDMKNTMFKGCPSRYFSAGKDYSDTIRIPSKGTVLYPHSFCYWEIANKDDLTISVTIAKSVYFLFM